MNSWDKSDSYYHNNGDYVLGENDHDLCMRLCKAGPDHRKFMRQIFVSVDITAPLYWWKEYDTYKVGTVANSTSTMHKIHSKEFTLDDFSCDHMTEECKAEFIKVVRFMETLRQNYLVDKDKKYWYDMIQFLPTSYNQMRTCTLTYENLVNIYHARKSHKLDEWHTFCDWIESLPYSEFITGNQARNN